MNGNLEDRGTTMQPAVRKSVGRWVVMPILILLLAAVYLALFSPVIAWMLGGGSQGTFIARDLDCHKGCAWFGDFTGASRNVVLRDVRFANVNGLPNIKAGTVIPATDISSGLYHGVAYPRHLTPHGILSPSILVVVILGLLPIILLLLWIRTVPFRYWRRNAVGRPG
jgi:hypothetical protein